MTAALRHVPPVAAFSETSPPLAGGPGVSGGRMNHGARPAHEFWLGTWQVSIEGIAGWQGVGAYRSFL
jgi:hypothetical protein